MMRTVQRRSALGTYTAHCVTFDWCARMPEGCLDLEVEAEVFERAGEVTGLRVKETGERFDWRDLPPGELEAMEAYAVEVWDEDQEG